MNDQGLEDLIREIEESTASTNSEVEEFRIQFLGKKGRIKSLFSDLKDADAGARKKLGAKLNEVKNKAEAKFETLKSGISSSDTGDGEALDLSLPGLPVPLGTRHPISIVRNQMSQIFERIGFTVSEGPEIETDWNNFTALNIPEDHPARDMQDTFFIQTDPDILLRTHTSPQQIRVMESSQPPIRIICPGRVYRNETISARAHCIFHQIEGLYIDENVSFADLKQTLFHFTKEMFGKETKTH